MKNIFPLIMSVVFLAVLVGTNIYLSRRFAWIFSMENRTWLHVFFALFPVLIFAGLFGFSNSVKWIGSVLYGVSAFSIGLILYLLIMMLLIDLVHLVYPLRQVAFGVAVLTLALLITGYGTLNSWRTRTSEIDVKVKGLTQEVRLMHLSDIHLGHFRSKAFLEKLVSLSNENSPDLVVITGDLFDGRIRLDKSTLEPLSSISVPVYFVEGNHDVYSGIREIKQLLRESGIRVLENEVEESKGLQIVGLNHMRADSVSPAMHSVPQDITIRQVLEELTIDRQKPAVLLHHSPDGVEYAEAAGIDLYLSGHTHGGQLFPVNFMNDLIFKYNKGLHEFGNTKIYTSMGAGTFGPPMRIGTRSEVTMIRLLPG